MITLYGCTEKKRNIDIHRCGDARWTHVKASLTVTQTGDDD